MLNVILGSPQRHQSLTIYPLLAPDAPELPYALMADSLGSGALKITEVGAGTVPELLAINAGEATILVLDGEQLVGARQNRTTNRSLLLPARSQTKIPVSCMEQGRWHSVGEDFKPTTQSSPSGVRRKAREVEASFAARGDAPPPPVQALSGAQGSVWEAIGEYSSTAGAHSGTGALDHVYEARVGDIDEAVRAFTSEGDQVGVVAFLGGRPLGMDVIGCRSLYARLHERLLRGYAMDALGSRRSAGRPGAGAAQRYLDQVHAAPRLEAPTIGSGRYAILSGMVVGGELTDAERVVHLSAFPALHHGGGRGPEVREEHPIAPPSWRRRIE